jgi:transposase
MRNQPLGAVVYGIDLGKTRFDVVGCDAAGQPIQRVKFSRDTLLTFFAAAPKALIGMEACPGAQWMARKLGELGHTVRIIVKSNKNDARDAEAIAEAVIRPTMRFVEIKPCEQIDLQALHRVRDRIVGNRTQLICQMRAFCLEYGIAIRPGTGAFKLDIARIITDETNDLTPAIRGLLRELWGELKIVDVRLAVASRQVEGLAAKHDTARRLMTIPGIGPIGATALIAAVGNGRQFRKARDLAAWLGLVPRQNSTGGKTTLLGISKRGNPYIRRLLIHGARSCMIHLDRSRDRIGVWLKALDRRMHRNKAIVALANKIARIAWALLRRPHTIYERIAPGHA